MSLDAPHCSSTDAAVSKSVEILAQDQLEERMKKIHFSNTHEELKASVAEAMKTKSRVVVLVDGVGEQRQRQSTYERKFNHMMEVARDIWSLYVQGSGAAPAHQNKFRIIILLGSRWELLEKVAKVIKNRFPQWVRFKTQIDERHGWQSVKCSPDDAIVLCPAEEMSQECNVIHVMCKKRDYVKEGVNMMCTNTACTWRSCAKSQTLGHSAEEPGNADDTGIYSDDQIMYTDEAAEKTDDESGGSSAPDSDPPQPAEPTSCDTGASHKKKSSRKNRLWRYGRPMAYYHKVLEGLGQSGRASAAVVISATAHPSHWVACVQQHLDTFVYTRSWSNHSTQHGLALGKSLLLENILKDLNARKSVATGNSGIHTSSDFKFNNFVGMNQSLTDYDQIIEAYNINQGPQWYDGLNLSISDQELEQQSAKLTETEQESHNVSIVADDSNKGLRNLITTNGVAPGQVACPVSALFFDDYDKLNSFLKLPGNSHLGSRVVEIANFHHNKIPVTIFAVMVGAARFVQHFTILNRAAPNCILQFEQHKGFNSGSLNLLAKPSGVGIAPQSPLLLNFGMAFNHEAAKKLSLRDQRSFMGALDRLFKQQSIYLKDLNLSGSHVKNKLIQFFKKL